LRHLYAQTIHCFLERGPVLTPYDGINLNADYLDAILIEDSGTGQLSAQVETSLPAQVGEQGIRLFFLDNLRHHFEIERFNIRHIRHLRVSHNGRRI